MEFKSDSSVKRVMKNGFFSAIRFGVFALSGFLFIPFLVRHYGNGTYSLIALAGFLTQYVGLLAGCIGSSIGRFLNVALNKNDWNEANEIFSTAIVANIGLVLVQIPLFAWGIYKLEVLIDFPPEMATDFRIMVICNVLVFMITMIMGVFSTPVQASNRIDLSMKMDVLGQILQMALLVFLIQKLGPKLWIIGVVQLALSFVGVATTYYFYRKLARNLVFRRKHVTRKWVRPVMNMAGWSIVAGLGQILFQKTDVWIINRFIDPGLAGVCAALLIWPNFVQQIAKQVSALIMPVVMIDYSQGRYQRVRDVVMLMTKVFSLMSLFICGGLLVLGAWVLDLWMGPDYRQYQWFLILMLLHYPLTLGREAVWLLFPAYNKMNYLGVSNLISGALNIILSLALVFLGYGLPGVIVATGISLVLQRTLFLSYFATKLIDVKYREFFNIYLGGILLVGVVGVQHFVIGRVDFLWTGIACLLMGTGLLVHMCLRDAAVGLLIQSILGRRRKESEVAV